MGYIAIVCCGPLQVTVSHPYGKMELEGFGAPLQGRALYVCATPEKAWIPWEFISGTPYNYKILVTGDGPIDTIRHIEHSHTWNAILRPHAPKDWSCLATIVRSMGPVVLLVFDTVAPPAPPSFVTFLDSCLSENRVLLTRIWVGTHVEIPTIPDAIFYPVLDAQGSHTEVYDMFRRLPARAGHGAWAAMSLSEWDNLVYATRSNTLGIVISDINESAWTLFWHKVQDSTTAENAAVLVKRGFSLLHTGMAIIDRADPTRQQ